MKLQINTDSQQLLSFLRASSLDFEEKKDHVEVDLKTDADIQKLTRFLKTRNIYTTDNNEINKQVIDHHYDVVGNRELSL